MSAPDSAPSGDDDLQAGCCAAPNRIAWPREASGDTFDAKLIGGLLGELKDLKDLSMGRSLKQSGSVATSSSQKVFLTGCHDGSGKWGANGQSPRLLKSLSTSRPRTLDLHLQLNTWFVHYTPVMERSSHICATSKG